MQRLFGVLLIAATYAAGLSSASAQADEGRSGPFRLLPTATVAGDGTTSVDVTQVQWGWGGYSRQYSGYSGGYYQSRSYYGGYPTSSYSYSYPSYGYSYPSYGYSYPSYGYSYPSYGYSYPSYGYQPYSSAYRGWYGGRY